MRRTLSREPSRRDFVRQILEVGGSALLARFASSCATASILPAASTRAPDVGSLSLEDDQFLNDLEKANFLYFWEQASPKTGVVKDRCNVHIDDTGIVGSIAATGFGLTALCIGSKRGFVSRAAAQERVLVTLRSLWGKLPNHRGFFYHWGNINTGERVWDSEVSSVDTTILLCGVLACREYFKAAEVQALAEDIFNRVEWTWLSEDTTLLPHGWTPEIGFLPYRWDNYSELMMMYLLGLGSTSYTLRDETWTAWKRL